MACRVDAGFESVPRIRKCLNQLSLEEIWYRPNAETVSVGNLMKAVEILLDKLEPAALLGKHLENIKYRDLKKPESAF